MKYFLERAIQSAARSKEIRQINKLAILRVCCASLIHFLKVSRRLQAK